MTNFSDFEYFMDMAGIDLLQTGFSFIIGLVGYVLLAFGLYTVAKRRGVRNPWLAWLPFGQSWMLGCISDQYQFVAWRRNKNKRKAMLWLDIISAVLCCITLVLLANALVELFRYVDIKTFAMYGEVYMEEDMFAHVPDEALMEIASAMMKVLLPAFLLMGTTIALTVLRYLALHDLYRSCDPSSATAYTLLSIFLGNIAMGVAVLMCRNKDFGMHPPQPFGYTDNWQLPPEQNWQPPQNPWQNNQQ